MSTSSNRILSIYNSRKNILEILESRGYDVDDYNLFSINEIDAMYKNNQLDMLLKNNKTSRTIYIKYYLNAKQVKKQDLDDIIEDLFVIDEVLTKDDTIIVITDDEPNDTITAKIKYLYDHDNIFVVINNIKRLQFNILEHSLVPKCNVLTDIEVEQLKHKYNLKSTKQLPEVSRFDPQALAICLRPGQVCRYIRKSTTAISTDYYRICV